MENRFVQTAFKVYFMAIAVLMYYFLTEVINLGLFITYRHAFALVLFVSVFFAFLLPHSGQNFGGLAGSLGVQPHLSHL